MAVWKYPHLSNVWIWKGLKESYGISSETTTWKDCRNGHFTENMLVVLVSQYDQDHKQWNVTYTFSFKKYISPKYQNLLHFSFELGSHASNMNAIKRATWNHFSTFLGSDTRMCDRHDVHESIWEAAQKGDASTLSNGFVINMDGQYDYAVKEKRFSKYSLWTETKSLFSSQLLY